MKRKFSSKDINKIFQVTFYDHMSGDKKTEPLLCTVWGKLVKQTPKYITLLSWEAHEDEDDNNETFVIVMSTIEDVKILK